MTELKHRRYVYRSLSGRCCHLLHNNKYFHGAGFLNCLLTFCLLFTVSCERILFNDEPALREISLTTFSAVRVCGIFNISLVQDSADHLTISSRNNINSISAVIKDDTLIIADNKGMSLGTHRNTINLHLTALSYLETTQPVNIESNGTLRGGSLLFLAKGEIAEVRLDLEYDTLYFVNSANTLGNFHFTGKADYCTFFNRYGSNIFARQLVCSSAEIVDDSVGDVQVNATDKIRAYIWASGDIYYCGSPVIEIPEKRGEGRLIRME